MEQKSWNMMQTTVDGDIHIREEGRKSSIAIVVGTSKRDRENAAMMAAAPALLAALKELVQRCDGPEGVGIDGSNIQTIMAHAAIAKAECQLEVSA